MCDKIYKAAERLCLRTSMVKITFSMLRFLLEIKSVPE